MKNKLYSFLSIFVAFAMMISLIMVKIPVEGITTSTSTNLKIHYYRYADDYSPWDVYLWQHSTTDGTDGISSTAEFTAADTYGKVASTTFDTGGKNSIGIIIRKSDWSDKDISANRYIDLSHADSTGNLDVYVLQGDAKLYYSAADVDKSPSITAARMDTYHTISFSAITPITVNESNVKLMQGTNQVDANVTFSTDKKSGTITTKNNLDINKKYTVFITGFRSVDVKLGQIFSTNTFKKIYNYNGDDLGAIYSKNKTTFKVWTPTAESVSLNLYSAGSGGSPTKTITMKKGNKGVWSIKQFGDLAGEYYTYSITVNGTTNETQDVYSKAVGVNGDRSMVVDLSKTNPTNWSKDKGPVIKNQTDAIIYEVNIRDITESADSGIKLKGKFLGLTETGTKSNEGQATGIEHLKELGVNEVHILPFFDFSSIDENKLYLNNYNWGYDPKNFMSLEGSYSTDPTLGNIRIDEMKKMIQDLHKAGIGVIMDSVFNHTADYTQSCFNRTVPDYYYRENADGSMINNSGCGNDTASERSMFSKYMIDATTYWAKEYHIDGFRFDLMGLHDIDTMNNVRADLNKINHHILMYGEGWNLGNEVTISDDQKATKTNESKLNDNIASFSDDMRDGIRGTVFSPATGGFVDYNGKWLDSKGKPYTMANLKEQIKFGIVASTQHDSINYSSTPYASLPWAKEPTQTVNYASCHDNNTLWDLINLAQPTTIEADKIKMDEQSTFIVLTSQGIPFLQNGQEMLGTKPDGNGGYVSNSYNSPDSVNAIDWSRKSTYKNVVSYSEGLIKLRKAHPAFRMATTTEIQKNLKFFNTNDNTIGYTISNNANGDSWKNIAIIINANAESETVTLPAYGWKEVASGEKAGINALATVSGNTVVVPARSSMVLADSASYNRSNLGICSK
ncbi:type I pullulanase [Clostridium sp.]|uniref:type I pullulanase n=1 Tax=Clostridium sp. TaxID=1506 RepID=UPI00260DC686|nr:type I pullulanase [uncultured Clostridium sp.]